MDEHRILQNAVRDEIRRTVLREAVGRFDRQVMDDEERQVIVGRIKRLKRIVEPVTENVTENVEEALDVLHSGLERLES